jgi:hypothetical protein
MPIVTEGEWVYLSFGRKPMLVTAWRRLALFCGIVGRAWHVGWISPRCAWRVCAAVHPWGEKRTRWARIEPPSAPGRQRSGG